MTDYQPHNSRQLLLDLGVTPFNATMMVQTVMMAPAITEAASAPVMMLVQHIQMVLRRLGAPGVNPTGIVDHATDQAMSRIVGTNWLHRTWFDVIRMLVDFKRSGRKLTPQAVPDTSMGLFDLNLGLPDVPGGIVTYGVGAYFLYRFLKKRS